MFERLRRLFGKEPAPVDVDEAAMEAWYEEKSRLMEATLGREHDMVMHAIIPYAVGGGLDLYYYPHGVPGTGVATKELCELPGGGPANRACQGYELVMFTKHPIALDDAQNAETPFARAHANINAVLNPIARYSGMAQLNPNETCEFPADFERIGGKCLVFDLYGSHRTASGKTFGLLLVMEVYRSEMDHAREHGGAALLKRLKDAGHYPYSDLPDRRPVV